MLEIALALALVAAAVVIGALVVARRQPVAATPLETPLPAVEPQPAHLADEEVARIVAQLSEAQAAALRSNREEMLALGEQQLRRGRDVGQEQLKASQAEIEKGLRQVADQIKEVRTFVDRSDKEVGASIAGVTMAIKNSDQVTRNLATLTQDLGQALTSGQRRGQWGERMAEDILRAAGMIEGVQYERQQQIEGGTGRPDFTFYLPNQHLIHMDVKFPLDNYRKYLSAETEAEKAEASKQFLRQVRQHLRSIETRGYTSGQGLTVDYVIVFIPNEQVYGFIHEQDEKILDEALAMKLVMCSPFTLFAVLAVIRQAVENFKISQQSHRILGLLGGFSKQWETYNEALEKLGRQLSSTQAAYQHVQTTRTNQLQKQVDEVERLRREVSVEPEVVAPAGYLTDAPELPTSILDAQSDATHDD